MERQVAIKDKVQKEFSKDPIISLKLDMRQNGVFVLSSFIILYHANRLETIAIAWK